MSFLRSNPRSSSFSLQQTLWTLLSRRRLATLLLAIAGAFLVLSIRRANDLESVKVLGARFFAVTFCYLAALVYLQDRGLRYMLIIPSTIWMAIVSLIPIGYLVNLSLQDITMLNFRRGGVYIGLENYRYLLTQDRLFWEVTVRTFEYVFITLLLQFLIGLALALLLDREFRGRDLITNALLIPVMTTPIVVANLWKYLLNLNNGGLNVMLREFFGLDPIPWLTREALPIIGDIPTLGPWLVENLNATYAFTSIILVNVWQWTPFVFLLLLAGLRSLPQEVLEAAKVDGASGRQRLQYIILPMLRPVISVVILIRLVDLIKVYDQIWALFGNATYVRTLNIHIYTLGIDNQNYGRGAALSVMVLLMTLGITVILLGTLFRRPR